MKYSRFAGKLFALLLACTASSIAQPVYNKLLSAVSLDAVGDSVMVSGHGFGTVGFQVSGTWVGTIQFSGSIDGTNWVGLTGYNAASRAGDSTTTENGVFYVGIPGTRYVKAGMTARSSGTAVVTTIATDDIAVLTSASASGGGGAEGSVDVLSISAGNNNIGNVDIVTLPALVAGSANIGDVDVATIAAGDNNIGNVDVVSLPALASGTNNIGDVDVLTMPTITVNAHAVTNAGTFATQVDGAALTSLQLTDNLVLAEDAPHSNSEPGVQLLGVRRDANTTLAAADNDYGPLQLNADGSLKVAITAGAGSGGTSIADDAAFTPASTSVTPIAGFADETSPDAVDEGDAGVVRMTLSRALHVNLRDASGNELSVGGQYAEDAAHVTADMLMMAGAVRRDTPASSTATDGDNATLNTSSAGRLWTSATIDAALPAGTNNIGDVDVLTLPGVAGTAAHDAAISGNPVRVGARAMSADVTAVTTGDAVDVLASLLGKVVTLPYALPGVTWSYPGAAGGLVTTGGVTVKAAGAAGVRNYVTSIQCMNSHQTTGTEVLIRDGAAGTVLFRGWAQAAGGGFAAKFETPLRGTAATLVEIAEVTTTATAGVVCNLQGYEAGE